jgi:RNA polymerase sigma-B factor
MHRSGERQHDCPAAVTSSGSSAEGERGEDAHLVRLHQRYADLAGEDPERQQLRDQLITGYLSLAEHLARRFANRGEPLEDLVQVATVGLIHAVDRFEPARGGSFLSFAIPTITGEIRRYFRDHGWSARVPRRLKDLHVTLRDAQTGLSQQLGRAPRPSEIAQRLALPTSEVIEGLQAGEAYQTSSLDEILSSASGSTTTLGELLGDLDAYLDIIEDREALRPLLAKLSPRDRTILALRFFRGLTQTQIADQVGLSQMHVSRILRQTLAFLQERMAVADDLRY